MNGIHRSSDFAVIGCAVGSGGRSVVDPGGGRARRRHRSSPGCPEQAGASSASPARDTDGLFWPVFWVAAPCLTTKLPCRGPRRCPRCAGALACPGCLRALVGFGMASLAGAAKAAVARPRSRLVSPLNLPGRLPGVSSRAPPLGCWFPSATPDACSGAFALGGGFLQLRPGDFGRRARWNP